MDYETEHPYQSYDPNFNPDEVMMRLQQLQSRIASTLTKVDRQDGEIIERQSQISQTVDEISLEVYYRDSGGVRYSRIQQNADAIMQRVSYTDYTGANITSLIVQDAASISLLAENLNLNGLVTFTNLSTSGMTIIDGGNIYGGTITGSKWQSSTNQTPFEIYIGTTQLYKTFTVYNGAIHLYYTDQFTGVSTHIFEVDMLGNVFTNGAFISAGEPVATQAWVQSQGYSTGGGVEWTNTYQIQRGGASLKFLASVPTIQARNYYDTGWGNFEGNAYSNVSKREYKKDIGDYTGDALTDIANTPVHTYRYNDDLDTEPLRIGLIYDEVPMEIMQFNSGVDIYAMASLMWKGIQQLNERVKSLETTAKA